MTTDLYPNVAALLKEVETLLNAKLLIKINDDHKEGLDPEASFTKPISANTYEIHVPKKEFLNFCVAHELLHLKQYGLNVVTASLAFPLNQNNLSQVISEVGDFTTTCAIHQLIIPALKDLDVLTYEVQQAILTRVLAVIPKEQETDSAFLKLSRALQILDTFIFCEGFKTRNSTLHYTYPLAFDAAEKLLKSMRKNTIDTNRKLRGTIVKGLNAVTEFYQNMGIQLPALNQTMAVSPVLSDRQLNRQHLSQLFELWNPNDLISQQETTYLVGIDKTDHQASFVLKNVDMTPENIQKLYQLSPKEVFEQYSIAYCLRDGHTL
ncbi:hypothetical protein R4Y45_01605 [Holzapfeliella sp. He02]|uniref:Peptidase M48 domain-containing protein n=1 Tax=Holzapfeliella saturejae TaxID=3082953 RepID=A0ABU8SFZ4_9LACO